ncbi:hypothetical protein Tco_0654577 [Tanacetum coccineum]|uniref:Phospholipase-like protein n=1 Tax=Tanacetum coccineum TaxID=301880 RepID=A0ABQ4X403_9ASTR
MCPRNHSLGLPTCMPAVWGGHMGHKFRVMAIFPPESYTLYCKFSPCGDTTLVLGVYKWVAPLLKVCVIKRIPQVQQKEDEIFINQDKYVAEILKKFDFVTVKTASTPIETNKALVKDEEAEDVDVHLYRSMIGSLMYLTASRPNIMFAICACARMKRSFPGFSDEDAIQLCLLLSLEVIFMGRELVSVVDDVLLRMVDNLDAWNTFPWGEHIWRQLYDTIRNVSSKHKLEHLDGLRKNPNHVPSYSLSGFLFAFKSLLVNRIVGGPKCQKSSPEQWHRREKLNFSSWSISASFFHRSPPVSIEGLHGEYLNKRSAARAAKQKDRGEFQPGLRSRQEGREAALIDRVITLKTNRIEKDESLNKFVPQIEDLLKSISEDESGIKDNTSKIVKKDVGDVYCCDINGHVPGVLMLDEKGDCEIIRLADQRQHDDISKMAEEAEQKIESEIQRLYDHREARLNKIVKEENKENS